jgi:hypothetical protein
MATQVINGVKNYYGPRTRHEATFGGVKTEGVRKELVLTFQGDNYLTVSGIIPAGAMIVGSGMREVTEVFALTGNADNTILIGAATPATNFLATVTKAQAEAIGTSSGVSGGSLLINTVVAVDTTITVSIGGTTPAITPGTGKMKFSIPYMVI